MSLAFTITVFSVTRARWSLLFGFVIAVLDLDVEVLGRAFKFRVVNLKLRLKGRGGAHRTSCLVPCLHLDIAQWTCFQVFHLASFGLFSGDFLLRYASHLQDIPKKVDFIIDS